MATRIEPLMTIADLDAMPDDEYRYEIIEGELFVSRSPSLTHQTVSGNLFRSIDTYLIDNPIGRIWATPGVILSEFSGVMPDLVYISHQRRAEIASGDRVTGSPDLVIEIVSPGSENERRDRVAALDDPVELGERDARRDHLADAAAGRGRSGPVTA